MSTAGQGLQSSPDLVGTTTTPATGTAAAALAVPVAPAPAVLEAHDCRVAVCCALDHGVRRCTQNHGTAPSEPRMGRAVGGKVLQQMEQRLQVALYA